MIKRGLEELTCIKVDEGELCIDIDRLQEALCHSTSEIIYCIKKEQLCGIISVGDIFRGYGCKSIEINTKFTKLSSWNAIKAKKLFADFKNIHKIPIVDMDGRLLGDYSRWDDMRFLRRNKEKFQELAVAALNEKKYNISRYLKRYKEQNNDLMIAALDEREDVILVSPSYAGTEKSEIFKQLKSVFNILDLKCTEASKMEVLSYVNRKSIILFVDIDELKGTQAICGQTFNNKTAEIMTYQSFLLKGSRAITDIVADEFAVGEVLEQLQSLGVQCYTLSCRENINGYLRKYTDKQAIRLEGVSEEKRTEVRKEIAEDFYGELYTDKYWKEIMLMPFAAQNINGVNRLTDVNSKYLNVKNGERRTCNQPEQFDRTIYFFGPCIVIGNYVEDQHTIESFLQSILIDKGYQCRVVNCGCWVGPIDCGRIMETKFREGDVVIVYSYDKIFEGITDINIVDVADINNIPVEWSTDRLLHCNHKANKLYAEYIFEVIEENIKLPIWGGHKLVIADRKKYVKQIYINRYFSKFEYRKYKRIGAIVMNCNPFTLGHRYLIEEAHKRVDFLIIFVVEENKSVFSFEERFDMVSEGVKDMEHIMVVPSGDFILSQQTFPEYFIKVADEDIFQNVDNDITLFADCICNQLNICYRFVGNEPNDLVTRAYNDAMKRILPAKGIEVIEIMRMNNDDECISASLVRKYFENDEIEKACQLLPDTTRFMWVDKTISAE